MVLTFLGVNSGLRTLYLRNVIQSLTPNKYNFTVIHTILNVTSFFTMYSVGADNCSARPDCVQTNSKTTLFPRFLRKLIESQPVENRDGDACRQVDAESSTVHGS